MSNTQTRFQGVLMEYEDNHNAYSKVSASEWYIVRASPNMLSALT
jgi:hypothetical protein